VDKLEYQPDNDGVITLIPINKKVVTAVEQSKPGGYTIVSP